MSGRGRAFGCEGEEIWGSEILIERRVQRNGLADEILQNRPRRVHGRRVIKRKGELKRRSRVAGKLDVGQGASTELIRVAWIVGLCGD